MQSLLAFCSICLQLSSLGVQKSELVLKRDEACTLCLTELLQPSNNNFPNGSDKPYREILNDGLYFNNPLLQDALKLKLEQQLLAESDVSHEAEKQVSQETDIPDPVSRMLTQEQIEELFENLVQTVQKLSSFEKPSKGALTKQKNLAYQIINNKVQLLHVVYKKASLDLPNKPSLPAHLKNRESDIEALKSQIQGLIQEEFDLKVSELSSPSTAHSQPFSEKIQELKREMMLQGHSTQASEALIQEISLLQSQASQTIERLESDSQLNLTPAMDRLDKRFQEMLSVFEDYAKPIKNGLKAGERVATNGHLTSENGVFNLVMQKDWNLVLYRFSTPIWATTTYTGSWAGTNPELFLDKKSGVLKIAERGSPYAKTEVNLAHKNYTGDAQLRINNNGTIDIIGSNQELWRPKELNPVSNSFSNGNRFGIDNLLVSKNGIYSLLLREDCDLVLYEHSIPIWTSGPISSATKGQCELILTQQRSLVIKSWNQNFIIVPEHSTYVGKTTLLVTDDGALVIMGGDKELWNSRK